ncbi:MAG: transglutaminase domain-containing protein [Clostridiaceae bacterium]|nr:transglutaminase domain-containing protein [Clostridiaceae bacterium]
MKKKSIVVSFSGKFIAALIILLMVLPQVVLAADIKSFNSELDTAIVFAGDVQQGNNTMRANLPSGFDYTLCYRYLSMLYRDSYVFEYIPSPINAYIKVSYNNEAKHWEAEQQAARLAGEILDDSMTDLQKFKAIHTYLIDNCEYDMHAALNQATETGDAFSAYGALVNGLAVCDGLSSAFAMICRSAGLPCVYVASPEMNHSWNAVLYKGEVRYIDVTYDLTGNTSEKYFMLTENELSADHNWDKTMVKSLTSKIWDERYVSAYTLNRLGGLFRGSDKGWELDRNPTRAEAAIMLIRFLGLEDEVLSADTALDMPFKDVGQNYAPYVAALYELGLTNGTSSTTFSPDSEVRLQDYITLMLRALDFKEDKDQFEWQSAPEDALGLGVIDQQQYDYLEESVFDRGMMAYVSLIVLKADDANGVPLYQTLLASHVFDLKNIEENLI